MKWYEAKTWEEFNALPRKEREKTPDYLKCRMRGAKSFYDPLNDKVLANIDICFILLVIVLLLSH